MDTPLDEVRERAGLRPSRPAAAASLAGGGWPAGGASIRLSDVARAGRRSEELGRRTRWLAAGAAGAAAVVATGHGLIAGWLAHAGGGPWSVARALTSWPSPVAQQVLAIAAAITLAGLAIATGGFRRVSRELSWPLFAAVVAALLGAGPVLLACVVVVAWAAALLALALLVAAVMIGGLLAMLAGG